MNVTRGIKRSLFYAQKGYSLSSLPFMFLGYASSIYYLSIQNIPVLLKLFPHFTNFLIIAALSLPVFCIGVGYIFMKKSFLFKSELEVQIESNPIMAFNQHANTKNTLAIMKQFNIEPVPEYIASNKFWKRLNEKHRWKPT